MPATLTTDKIEIIRQADMATDAQIYYDYSGRGMYGEECFGLTCDNPGQYATFLLVMAQFGEQELAEQLAEATRTDSMGFQTIYYFPGWQIAEEDRWTAPEEDY